MRWVVFIQVPLVDYELDDSICIASLIVGGGLTKKDSRENRRTYFFFLAIPCVCFCEKEYVPFCEPKVT